MKNEQIIKDYKTLVNTGILEFDTAMKQGIELAKKLNDTDLEQDFKNLLKNGFEYTEMNSIHAHITVYDENDDFSHNSDALVWFKGSELFIAEPYMNYTDGKTGVHGRQFYNREDNFGIKAFRVCLLEKQEKIELEEEVYNLEGEY